ncbi:MULTISPECIES: NlpC/P60 family protein [unclassified Methylophaga]|jgi:cell wall-associated NlpC family hydrolase|uniref:NlpC/P60 family protein n=1 Tax=unclassified Methylophaga TaxID=2629249 RepID=UPI000C5D70AA|nr:MULTISPECIES: NlpC/P60 family protein [unclassified Methylophaga]MAX52393.1 hypothetical protein [Methylophaga sp.]|tara:strand:+ start:7513 stop:8040 length:528 start_codon:yes stop_codon:yes gene_type:complete
MNSEFDTLFNRFKRYSQRLLLLSLMSLMAACQTSPPVYTPPQPIGTIDQQHTLSQLYRQYQQWNGTPYRLGGNNRSGIDCSAFVQQTYQHLFGITMPRTTSQQILQGKHIKRTELKSGDLVFFRKGSHVGIYLEEDKFLHVSTKIGVTISSMHNSYWARYFWQAVRVKPVSSISP